MSETKENEFINKVDYSEYNIWFKVKDSMDNIHIINSNTINRISMIKFPRECFVIRLINDETYTIDKEQFDQLEKMIFTDEEIY